MNWYGPAGIGTARGIAAFRRQHQIPFLKALPDRRVILSGEGVMFGEGAYVATTGFPNMQMTVTGDGWLGIAPGNQAITMRSLDFWRCENGLIRENWVLVDLLHVYRQIGVDVFARMREMTYARQGRT
jgi:predicted ester cyclase